MRTIQSTEKVTLKVTKDELFEDKWLNFKLLSAKLAEAEKNSNMCYKQLRNRFYNSEHAGKLNVKTVAGIKFIDTEKPMKATASLEISFERV